MFEIFKKKKEPESKLMIEANEELLKRRLANSNSVFTEKKDSSMPLNERNLSSNASSLPNNNLMNVQHTDISHSLYNAQNTNEQNNQSLRSFEKDSSQHSLPEEFPDLDKVIDNENLSFTEKSTDPLLDQILSELRTIRSQNDYILSILQKLEKRLE